MKDRIILDLCGGTGAWSRPYKDAGYDVRLVTLPEHDVRLYRPPNRVHGVLAAPPCTDLASSGARWWKKKGLTALLDALSVVDACLRIVHVTQPTWWAIENPVGRLSRFIGSPRMWFDPCEFGDPYIKKTGLWGSFADLTLSPVPATQGSKFHTMSKCANRAAIRSVTPPGFAEAFFKANP